MPPSFDFAEDGGIVVKISFIVELIQIKPVPMSQYATYQKFFSPEQAEPVLSILKEHEVPFQFIKSKTLVDSVIGGETSFDNLYELKIIDSQFEEVNQLLRQKMEVNLEDLESDYYLFSFTEKELVEILQKPDEWSNQDYSISRQILKERGIEYTSEELATLRKERLHVLARPEKLHQRLLYVGYAFALFGGILGLIIGLSIWRTKKTLPNGKREYVFSYPSREHGKLMVILSAIFLVINIVLGLSNDAVGLTNLIGGFLFHF